MRNIVFMFILACICISQVACSTSNNKSIDRKELSKEEKDVINALLTQELSSLPYKLKDKDSIIIITNAISKMQVIEDYISMMSLTHNSILDSIQIAKIRRSLANEKSYHWKISDFPYFNKILKSRDELAADINSGSYVNSPSKYIFHLSLPYFIEEQQALVNFISGSSATGFSLITSGLVLMEKNGENNWTVKKNLGSKYY